MGGDHVSITIDPNRTWKLIDERLASERDPESLANLLLVRRHMVAEAAGDIEGVLLTLCDSPRYVMNFPGGITIVANSQEPIRQMYLEKLVATGAHRIEYAVDKVIADRGAVYTEGHYLQAFPGKALIERGISVEDSDASYAAECRMVLVFPRDTASQKLTGEEVFMDRDMFAGIAERKVERFIEVRITPTPTHQDPSQSSATCS